MKGFFKNFISVFISITLVITSVQSLSFNLVEVKASSYGIANPRVSSGVTTWDCIYFGNYYQSSETDKEPIKWRVLSVDGNNAFLLSDKAIDVVPYNQSQNINVTWATSTIRSWLNGFDSSNNADGIDYTNNGFINLAFNSSEKSAIKIAEVKNSSFTVIGMSGMSLDTSDDSLNTLEYIYLPSVEEVQKPEYGFENNNETTATRHAKPTKYTAGGGTANSTYILDVNDNCYWWLRTYITEKELGNSLLHKGYAPAVEPEGEINTAYMYYWKPGSHPIRPVLHLDLSKNVWTHAGTVSSDGTMSDEATDFDETYINNGFKSNNKEFSKSEGYFYSDSYFEKDATIYNHSLATMSLCLAFSTYGDEVHFSDYDDNVFEILQECGFTKNINGTERYKQYHFNEKPTANSIGCAIGSKSLDENTELIAVAVRSGGYLSEWASNFTVGESSNHIGFDESAETIKDYIMSYITEMKISGKVKIWITGYSRGAAVATQAAAKLNDLSGFHYIENEQGVYVDFDKSSVYAYGFATPAGAVSSSNPHSANYNNIFNIIDYNDPVPLVAPENWGFDRYGITNILPYKEGINSNAYSEYISRIKGRMGSDYKVDNFGGTIIDNAILNNDTLGTYNRKLVNSLINLMGTRSDYVKKYQSEIRILIETMMAKKELEYGTLIWKITELVPTYALLHPYMTARLSQNLNLLADVHANQEYYVAWMQLMDSNYDNSLPLVWGKKNYRVVKVNCPVDVYVYNTNGELVASIIDDKPVQIPNSSIVATIDEYEQKMIYLPIEGEYDVKVIAREKCEVSYGIQEFNAEYGDVSRIVNYNNIVMDKGDDLQSTIETFSNEEIVNGAENGSDVEYVLKKDDINIKNDVDIKGAEEIAKHTYTVTVNFSENQGIVYGGGIYEEGSFAKLQVENKEGFDFEGFYVNGEKLSDADEDNNKYTIRFMVKANMNIEAKYVECKHKQCDAGKIIKNANCTELGIKEYNCLICGAKIEQSISKNAHNYTQIVENATHAKDGKIIEKCIICGEIASEAIIYYPKTITLSETNYVYNGKIKEPTVVVKDSRGKIIAPNYYSISYSKGRKKVGKYQVSITFKNGYSGVKELYFTISPKKTKLKKVIAIKSGLNIKWKKARNIKGYQVQYSTTKKFKKAKKITIKNAKATSKTIKKLKSNKKYYVRIRTYVVVDGNKIYSKWSNKMIKRTK